MNVCKSNSTYLYAAYTVFLGGVGRDKEQITNNLRKSTRQVVTCAIVKNNMDKGVMGSAGWEEVLFYARYADKALVRRRH